MEYSNDPELPPKLLSSSMILNVPGFVPKNLRTSCGYSAVIYKTVLKDEAMKSIIPKTYEKETIIIQVWKNNLNQSHTILRGSELGFDTLSREELVLQDINVQFNCRANDTTLISVTCDKVDETMKAVELNSIGLKIKDKTVDLTKIKI